MFLTMESPTINNIVVICWDCCDMTEWPGIHWMKMEDDMDLMELWIDNVLGLDEMRASHKDLLSVQKSTEIE